MSLSSLPEYSPFRPLDDWKFNWLVKQLDVERQQDVTREFQELYKENFSNEPTPVVKRANSNSPANGALIIYLATAAYLILSMVSVIQGFVFFISGGWFYLAITMVSTPPILLLPVLYAIIMLKRRSEYNPIEDTTNNNGFDV